MINLLSDFIIHYSFQKGIEINPIKLQKLLYFYHYWITQKIDNSLVFNELPEAWVCGAVYPSSYKRYKKHFFNYKSFVCKLSENDLSIKINKILIELNLDDIHKELLFAVLDSHLTISDEKLCMLMFRNKDYNKARAGLSPIDICHNQIIITKNFK